jgi:tRNA A58 N-methylase Trm61
MSISITTIRSIAEQKPFIKSNYFRPKSYPLLYLHFRILRPFLKLYTLHLLKKWKGTPTPWMTPAAIDILNAVLTPDMKGFEFGSGRSTLFIAPRIGELVSLEHDEKWYQHIQDELKNKKLNTVQYIHIAPEKDSSKTIGYPKNNYENYLMPPAAASCYTKYYSYIDQFPNEHFDFVIVDGRARVECAQHAIPKMKKGGMLILDNAERLRYRAVHDLLQDWEKVYTTSGITDTVFWFKP